MTQFSEPLHRRRFLFRAGGMIAGVTGTMLLSGCGGGSSGESESVPVVSAPVVVTPAPTPAPTSSLPDAASLNLALNLAYVGAQYFAYASTGAGLSGSLLSGVGQQGSVVGGRQVAFADDNVSRFAAELAADKLAHVTALRGRLADGAAAQPGLDFSATASSAFSTAASTAGIIGAGASFDAFSSDDSFLLGALFIEDVVAAAHRTLLTGITDAAHLEVVQSNLADTIYHGGMVRTMLATRAADNPALATNLAAVCASLAKLDGSNVGDQSLEADGSSANLTDADGNPIPFMRSTHQVLSVFYLSPAATAAGGFLPNGVNAVAV